MAGLRPEDDNNWCLEGNANGLLLLRLPLLTPDRRRETASRQCGERGERSRGIADDRRARLVAARRRRRMMAAAAGVEPERRHQHLLRLHRGAARLVGAALQVRVLG